MFYPHLESFLQRRRVGGPGAEGHKLGFLILNREHEWLKIGGKEYIQNQRLPSSFNRDRGAIEQPAKVTAHA